MTNWNAADYAKNSQGQFAWARSLIDSSPDMIVVARHTWQGAVPNVEFHVVDAQEIHFGADFDLAFSNSTLHWVPDHRAVLRGVARALKPGGRLVFSMGGQGTAAAVYAALDTMRRDPRWSSSLSGATSPHYFFGPEQYAEWLPAAGLRPTRIALVPKPMRHADRAALEGWVRTIWTPYIDRISVTDRARFVRELAAQVYEQCTSDDEGAILMPMVNLEVEAETPG